MSDILNFVKRDLKFHIDAVKENYRLSKDPLLFKPTGIQAFYGEQGSGKTITLIYFARRIRRAYPHAVVVSNIVLKDMIPLNFHDDPHLLLDFLSRGFDTSRCYIFYQSKLGYELVIKHVKNDKYGVIMLTDEYQNYFSNQDSRNVPPWVIEQHAQNRKQRRLHLVTSQDYDQINKQTRRRSDIAFKCRSIGLPFTRGAIFTLYWAFDSKKLDFSNSGRQTGANPLKFGCFFHSQKLRDSYDTYQVVFTGDENPNVYSSFNQNINLNYSDIKIKKKRRIFRKG